MPRRKGSPIRSQLEKHTTVNRWLRSLSETSAANEIYYLHMFLQARERLLEAYPEEVNPALVAMTPDELVEFQRENKDYQILDLIQLYVQTLIRRDGSDARAGYKQKTLGALSSFFIHNRAALPQDAFKVQSKTPRVVGALKSDDIKNIILASNPMFRAVFLCMFMAGMGRGELVYWSDNGYRSLREQLDQEAMYIRIEQPGRKQMRNKATYYTMIGGDALKVLKVYLQDERPLRLAGWRRSNPEKAELEAPIFITRVGTALENKSLYAYWTRKVKEIGLIDPDVRGTKSSRYGYNPHEMRDVFRTRWHKSGGDALAPEFMMGHIKRIDPNEYQKALYDESYLRREYRKALPWINIMTMDPEKVPLDEHERLQDRIEVMERRLETSEAEAVEANAIKAMLQHPEAREILLEAVKKLEKLKSPEA